MNAMIFAAGLGTRLKPITDTLPKALLPLNGKTLLEYQIQGLRQAGFTHIVVNVHHLAGQIVDYLRANRNFGAHVLISDESDMLLDTGGGLLKAFPLFRAGEPILACNVDILSNISIPAFLSSAKLSDLATLVVSDRPTKRYLLFDEQGQMRGWTNIATNEYRPSLPHAAFQGCRKLAFSGMQLLSPDIITPLREVQKEKGDKFSLIDLYVSVCQDKSIRAYVPDNYKMMDVGKIDQLTEAQSFAQALDI